MIMLAYLPYKNNASYLFSFVHVAQMVNRFWVTEDPSNLKLEGFQSLWSWRWESNPQPHHYE